VLGTQVSVQGQHTSQQVRAATKEKA
jgi:hypothetical protein